MNFRIIEHTGVAHDENPPGRGSGRYPYGSGENPNQHGRGFLFRYKHLKKSGVPEKEIAALLLGAKYYNKNGDPVYYTATELKARYTLESKKVREEDVETARRLYNELGNVSEVGRRMGKNESTIRNLLKEDIALRQQKYIGAAEMLKKRIAESEIGAIDVGKYSELYAGISESTKKTAIAMLEQEGYTLMQVKIPQADGKNQTNVAVLARQPREGETAKDVYREVQQNKYKIAPIRDFSPDGGATWWTPEFPQSLSSKRVMVRYADDPVSGELRDGAIQIRRNVKDLNIGSNYAQVRIMVDDKVYLKGMAMYAEDDSIFPKGVDVIYNTNKKRGTPLIDPNATYNPETGEWSGKEVAKRLKMNTKTGEVDRDNPFGATIKAPGEYDGILRASGQTYWTDKNGEQHLSPINKISEEGDWSRWSKNLASQMLSKQPAPLVKEQIDFTEKEKAVEFDELVRLTNPVLKQKVLEDFGDACDAQAAELSVRGFKNQSFQVLIPVPSLKENQIYAPNYKTGEKVALIRYPHGGTFEIPILTVTDKNPEASAIMSHAKDAVGINPKVASRLSGADFDGDTVTVIPVKSTGNRLKSTPPLKGLEDFDPKSYKLPDDAPPVTNEKKQTEMGKVTNLITDMSLNDQVLPEHIARAVRHSMVVIDSEKHHLNYQQSEKDNKIIDLKYKYQGTTKTGQPAGASTIISKAGAEVYAPLRKEITDTSKMTESELRDWNAGKKVYRNTGEKKLELIKDPSKMTEEELIRYNAGKKVYRETNELKTMKIQRMYLTDDAYELVRDKSNKVEMAYAEYANFLKNLANSARKEARSIKPVPVSKAARQVYADEVDSLDAKLRLIQLSKPVTRRADMLTNELYDQKLEENPGMDYEHRQRTRAQCAAKARSMVGAKREDITFTDREWEAIQAGAISSTKQKELFQSCNQDALRQRATPKDRKTLTPAQISLIDTMKAKKDAKGNPLYTNQEIANRIGCSLSTLFTVL